MLCYVDDLLHIVFNPKEDTYDIYLFSWLKEGFGPLDQYLDDNV